MTYVISRIKTNFQYNFFLSWLNLAAHPEIGAIRLIAPFVLNNLNFLHADVHLGFPGCKVLNHWVHNKLQINIM